jgi:sensor c-di-GMP phosphodiesterase-like protein
VDTLKIDRTFISAIDTDRETRKIVRIIIMLAHQLGLKVVAEGAETAEQVNLLKQLRCELVQGYFFARPGDHAATQALLSKCTAEASSLHTAVIQSMVTSVSQLREGVGESISNVTDGGSSGPLER